MGPALGTVTVSAAVPLFPSLVAVIVTGPAASAVTNPLPLTVARAGALLAQVTTRPLRAPPTESFGVAVNCNAAPTRTLAIAGLTVTLATGAGIGGGGGGGGVQDWATKLLTVSLPTSA